MKKILPVAALCSIFFIGCGGGAEKPAAKAPAEGGAASELVSGYDLANGKEVYDANCASCHDEGVLKSPKTGEVSAWTARIDQGMDTLIQKSIDGYVAEGNMPAKGGNDALTDEEVANAVAYMVNESVAK
ncbi:MAG: c-type cytochrome [Chlorobiales bacterium]|nr:c-type cytochrome [Chlorobiales bacterium]